MRAEDCAPEHWSFLIRPIFIDAVPIAELRHEAELEGLMMVERLADSWASGNRFDGAGESLVGAFSREQLIGIAALVRDPYEGNGRAARLRHVYVHPRFRRRGLATALIIDLTAATADQFDRIRLRAETVEAAAFYEAIGFARIASPSATHVRELQRDGPEVH